MLPSDKPGFSKLFTAVADYYSKEISVFGMEMTWNGLQQYELSEVQAALNAHMANPDTGQFMPRIADITRMLVGSTSDQAATAWGKVDYAVRCVGQYLDVIFDDPLVHRSIEDIGGWAALCGKQEKDWPFTKRLFEDRYRAYKSRNVIPEYPAVLLGIANARNIQHGFATQPPTVVGDPKLAERVQLGGALKGPVLITHGQLGLSQRSSVSALTWTADTLSHIASVTKQLSSKFQKGSTHGM